MGYYDDERDDRRSNSKRVGRPTLFFTALFSSIIGGFIVIYSLPHLIDSGYITVTVPVQDTPVTSPSVVLPEPQKAEEIHQVVGVKVESSTIEAVSKIEDTVVGVINIQQMRGFWAQQGQSVEGGTGSGVIFAKRNGKALVITNYHVIKGASHVEVSLVKGTRVKGEIIGSDPLTDLAVLEIPDVGVEKIAELGDSSHLQVGEPAIAIGNPLGLHFSRTVTQGIISSLDRSMPIDVNDDGQPDWQLDVIQTDAAINPGNSGGALINMAGQVIGINSLKISREGIEGLGFAIPINDVKPIIENLIQYGKVKRPYLGIVPKDLQEISSYHWQETLKLPLQVTHGVVVMEVVDQGNNGKGLKAYDVIVAMDGQPISSSAELRKFLYRSKMEEKQAKVDFYREGQRMSTNIQLYFE